MLRKFAIFCSVGFAASLIDWTIFNFFYWIGSGFVISISISWLTSMIFNFFMNRNITFTARGFSIKTQLPKWLIIHGVAFLIRIGIGNGVLYFFGDNQFNANLAFLSGLAISVPIVFFGSLFWAFKKK